MKIFNNNKNNKHRYIKILQNPQGSGFINLARCFRQRGQTYEPLRTANEKTGIFGTPKIIRSFCSDERLVSVLIEIILIFEIKIKYYFIK